jgi:hypothetical protein
MGTTQHEYTESARPDALVWQQPAIEQTKPAQNKFFLLRREDGGVYCVKPEGYSAARLEIKSPSRRLIDAIMMATPPVHLRVYLLARLALNVAPLQRLDLQSHASDP